MPSEAPQSNNKFYVTTPIYYVNARPHIGHAYTTIVADVLARRHCLLGDDTFFLTGTDEHGQKIERSATAAGIPPQQFTDQVSAEFKALWDRMGLTYDDYIRTTDPAHKRGVQQLFQSLYDRGFIYLSTYTGSYCVSDEAFVDLPAGTPCPDCGRPLETVTEENFFFKLNEFQLQLLNLIESNELLITPDTARNEVLSFLRGDIRTLAQEQAVPGESVTSGYIKAKLIGKLSATSKDYYVPGALKDLSISRSSFTWGIPVPEAVQQAAGTAQPHVVYVWLDALANYITAVGYGDDTPEAQTQFAKFWPADLHLVGKEITRFHCVYWPAFLMAAGLATPRQITANGWLLFDNAKMSKSRGNVVRTETILDAFGDHVYGKQFPDSTKQERDLFAADVLRYFLLREIPFGQDGSFSFDALVTRYNADLANGYGNLVSRTLSMVSRYFEGSVPNLNQERFGTLRADIEQSLPRFENEVDKTPDRAVATLQTMISLVDIELTARAPWKKELGIAQVTYKLYQADVLYTAAESIRIITALLYPILPYATAKVWAQLGLGDIELAARNGDLNNLTWGGLRPGTQLGPLSPIFPRADKSLTEVMLTMEDERNTPTRLPLQEATAIPMATEAGLPTAKANESGKPSESLNGEKMPTTPDTKPSTDPGAGPRTSSLDEPTGTLSVGGSNAPGATLPTTPGPYTQAPASGVFATPHTPAPAPTDDASQTINIDDFMKVELRVAQVLVAERIPKADKLLRLEVDLGPLGKRQILSGIAQHYTPEELIGRRIVVVSNLAPRKMRGLDSHGMLLAASEGPDGKPILATFGEDIALGSRVR